MQLTRLKADRLDISPKWCLCGVSSVNVEVPTSCPGPSLGPPWTRQPQGVFKKVWQFCSPLKYIPNFKIHYQCLLKFDISTPTWFAAISFQPYIWERDFDSRTK